MIGFTIGLTIFFLFFIAIGIIALIKEMEGTTIISFALSLIVGLILLLQVSEVVKAYSAADFYNKNFHTNYIATDIFWNSDIIKNQILGEKKNLNVKMEKGE